MSIDVSALITSAKGFFGLSWSSVINCFGSLCGWMAMGHIATQIDSFILLNNILCWLGFENINTCIVEDYIQTHGLLFFPLAILFFFAVCVSLLSEKWISNFFERTYGAVSWIGILLLISLFNLRQFRSIAIIILLMIAMTIVLWKNPHIGVFVESKWSIATYSIIILVGTLFYPILFLIRIVLP